MTYQQAVPWLYGLQWHGIKLGLENIARLLAVLGVPLEPPAAPRFLHVAGTNGKGSVCAMLDSILRAAGYRTGLFTSPHLVSFRERIRIDGEMISEEAAAAGLTEIRAAIEGWEHSPTFFEVTTALALAHFAREGVQLAVLETGLGGRLDATNIVTPLVSVITPIALDHQQFLGDTLAAIALEKAGIIKPGVPVVCQYQEDDAQTVLMHIAFERDAPLHLVVTPMPGAEIALRGSHQRWNAALAVHAIEVANIELTDDAVVEGLRHVDWPGRFQVFDDQLVLDGAHNPAAMRRLVATWREIFGEMKATVVMGAMRDKDIAGMCEALAPIAGKIIAVRLQGERSLPPAELCEHWSRFGIACTTAASARKALALALAETTGQRALVTGSLFLIGEILELLQGGGDGLPTAQ